MPESEYEVALFRAQGFARRQCPTCSTWYWTLGDAATCGETPCKEYDFLGHSPMKRPLTLRAMREEFLSFFEQNGHTRVKRYPIVARWRDDVFFTQASIYPFQPWVIDGVVDPPANPLALSQPCVRFNDVDNVGKTGQHFTLFEMLTHTAFNRKNQPVYWTDRTVELCHAFFTDRLGVDPTLLTYKESAWKGGGNSGPCLEVILGGAEVATLVFMQYKDANGNRIPMDTTVVDTGYGLERLTWVSQGATSAYEAVFGDMLTYMKRATGTMQIDERLLTEYSRVAGASNIESFADIREVRRRTAERVGVTVDELLRRVSPLENIYAVLDHARALMFVLADGVVPSNSREGYFARLLVRRGMRAFRALEINMKLTDLVTLFVQHYMEDFPEVFANRTDILKLLEVEQKRYEETLRRGREIVRGIEASLPTGGPGIVAEDLVALYDSHGLTPEFVKEVAESPVDIPDDFFARVAARHERAEAKGKDLHLWPGTPPSSRLRVYEDMKKQKFTAKVLAVDGTGVVLDQTYFYPEGGGQEADHGTIRGYDVADVQQLGDSVVHFLKSTPSNLAVGKRVKCAIDWDRRQRLKRHHTATHITLGAARKVLGNHVWQTGAHKAEDAARLDITHYDALADEEVRRIERLANEIVLSDRKLVARFVPREAAERKHGFRLYQGGSVPGAKLRIVEIPGWDVEACGGTHCARTSEVGLIKVLRSTRIQDGVVRLEYVAGAAALAFVQEQSRAMDAVREQLGVPIAQVPEAVARMQDELKALRKREEKTLAVGLRESLKVEDALAVGVTRTVPLGDRSVELRMTLAGTARLWQGVVSPGDAGDLKRLAGTIVGEAGNVAALAARGTSATILVGRSADVGLDCLAIAREAANILGGGAGGAADFAQGGGPKLDQVDAALADAVSRIRASLG